jgi:hypothetical protein
MWDSCTFQGSIQKTRCLQQPCGHPHDSNHDVSVGTRNSLDPRSFRSDSLPGIPLPPKFPSDNNRVPVLSNCQRPSADAPLGDRRMPQPPLRSPTHATGTKPMKVVARWPLLPPVARFFLVSHTPPHGPSTGPTPLLSKWVSGPSYTSRHLFRRHHLRLQRDLAGHRQTPLLGFPKIAPPSCAAEESTPAVACCRNSRRSFGIRGATADPCSVSAVFRRPDGLRLSNPAHVLQRATDHGVHGVLKRSAKTVASPCLSCPSKFSPRPQRRWRHSRGTSRVERHQNRFSPRLFTADLSSSPFPAWPSLHR